MIIVPANATLTKHWSLYKFPICRASQRARISFLLLKTRKPHSTKLGKQGAELKTTKWKHSSMQTNQCFLGRPTKCNRNKSSVLFWAWQCFPFKLWTGTEYLGHQAVLQKAYFNQIQYVYYLNNAGWMKKIGRQRGMARLTSNILQLYQIEGDVVGLPSKGVKMKPRTIDLFVYNSFLIYAAISNLNSFR